MDFLSSLFSNLWSLSLIVLFFGGSIFVHELGHFLAARRRGVKVTRFSIGFGPAIWKHTAKDGVEYRLSWIPLGGYVALPQLADMAAIEGESDVEAEKLPPITYTTKLVVFAAGAFFNIIFAFALATILWFAGRPAPEYLATTRIGYVIPTLKLADGSEAPSPAAAAGLKANDLIRQVDGRPVQDWNQFKSALVLGTGTQQDGQRVVRAGHRAGRTAPRYHRQPATLRRRALPHHRGLARLCDHHRSGGPGLAQRGHRLPAERRNHRHRQPGGHRPGSPLRLPAHPSESTRATHRAPPRTKRRAHRARRHHGPAAPAHRTDPADQFQPAPGIPWTQISEIVAACPTAPPAITPSAAATHEVMVGPVGVGGPIPCASSR
jgi:hypothetical protein